MTDWANNATTWFSDYCDSFVDLTEEQKINFEIKKQHSLRVAEISLFLADKLLLPEEEKQIAFLTGLLHDIGRFRQLVEYNTFNDEKSIDHAELSVQILKELHLQESMKSSNADIILTAILNHNKYKIHEGLKSNELMHAYIIRDADKLDILRVITEYYSKPNVKANHSLTWELPKGNIVSAAVAKEVLAGKQVSKQNVVCEIDVKIMQLSWVYDLHFRPAFELLAKQRYMEIIYNSLPKNDLVIEIYRKIKVFAENKIMAYGSKVHQQSTSEVI